MRKLILIIHLFLFPLALWSWENQPKIETIFKQAQVEGTFVLYDVSKNRWIGFNEARAHTRFSPASTFKIPHSLIGLSSGVVTSVDDLLPYTGPEKPMNELWKRDMGLREAIAISNVPIYQELARRIGPKRMREGIHAINYGNEAIGERIDRFWLDGPLAISAVEQVQFLIRLVQGKLPMDPDVQQNVRDILLIEKGTNWKLYAKTGWQNAPGIGTGWWVGWVEQSGNDYIFALNIDINHPADAPKRVEIGKFCLQEYGLLQTEQSAY